jgi:hypothetical protein
MTSCPIVMVNQLPIARRDVHLWSDCPDRGVTMKLLQMAAFTAIIVSGSALAGTVSQWGGGQGGGNNGSTSVRNPP